MQLKCGELAGAEPSPAGRSAKPRGTLPRSHGSDHTAVPRELISYRSGIQTPISEIPEKQSQCFGFGLLSSDGPCCGASKSQVAGQQCFGVRGQIRWEFSDFC